MTDAPKQARLEQQDTYLRTFLARVQDVETVEGDLWVALDRSAFYPESGGQPADTGTLGGTRVRDVQVRDGRVWHRVEGGPLEAGMEVAGEIDWERRFRHMQRHSAQHLLSQAFLHVDEAFETRSVGLGGPECTLDLAGGPSREALAQAEALVNRVAYRNLPIEAFEVDEADVPDYPLRRPPKVRGTVRLVKMGEFELSACGGTHLATTAEAAPIKILKAENIRGDLTRVTFRAGLEALDDYREKHEVAYGLAVDFSSRVGELPHRIAALSAAERANAQELSLLRERVAGLLAERLVADAVDVGGIRIVRHALPSADAELLRPLADALVAGPGTVALLAARDDAKAQLLFARSEDVEIDLRPVLRAALEPIDGRGGGRPERGQGGGTVPEGIEEALDRAASELELQP